MPLRLLTCERCAVYYVCFAHASDDDGEDGKVDLNKKSGAAKSVVWGMFLESLLVQHGNNKKQVLLLCWIVMLAIKFGTHGCIIGPTKNSVGSVLEMHHGQKKHWRKERQRFKLEQTLNGMAKQKAMLLMDLYKHRRAIRDRAHMWKLTEKRSRNHITTKLFWVNSPWNNLFVMFRPYNWNQVKGDVQHKRPPMS